MKKIRKMEKNQRKENFLIFYLCTLYDLYIHTMHNNIVLSKRKRIREKIKLFFILYASSFIVVDKYTPEDICMKEVRK